MVKVNEEKLGDKLVGFVVELVEERIVVKVVLLYIKLEDIRNNFVVVYEEDEVIRII